MRCAISGKSWFGRAVFSLIVGAGVGCLLWQILAFCSRPIPGAGDQRHYYLVDGRRLIDVFSILGQESVSNFFLWDICDTCKKPFQVKVNPPIDYFPTVSRSGRWLAVKTKSKAIRVWDLSSGDEITPEQLIWVPSGHLIFTPDGKLKIFTELTPEFFGFLDAVSGAPTGARIPHSSLTVSHSHGRFLNSLELLETGKGLESWDMEAGEVIGRFSVLRPMKEFTLSLDGKLLAGIQRGKARVQLWDGETGNQLPIEIDLVSLTGAELPEVTRLVVSPDKRWLAVGYQTLSSGFPQGFAWLETLSLSQSQPSPVSRIDFVDVVTGLRVHSLPKIKDIGFVADGNSLLVQDEEGRFLIYDWPLRKPWLRILAWSAGTSLGVFALGTLLKAWRNRRRAKALACAAG